MMLEKGKLYELDGRPWRCVLVNDCRAKLQPAWKERRSFVEPDGTEREFFVTPSALDVSPNSALREWAEVVERHEAQEMMPAYKAPEV